MTLHIPVDDPRRVGIERAMGIRTQPKHQTFRLEQYPRKPNLNCKANKHDWGAPFNVAGKLMVQCRVCGAQVFKDVLDHTLAKNEHQKAFKERNFLVQQRQLLLRKRVLESMERR